jgi:DNA-binding NarL/FixJ family response regulator
MRRILLVEDEKILRDAYEIMLGAQKNYILDVASNGAGFMEKAALAKKSPNTRIVIMSNLSSGEGLEKVLKLGAHRHAVKSDLAPDEVVAIIEEELQLVN